VSRSPPPRGVTRARARGCSAGARAHGTQDTARPKGGRRPRAAPTAPRAAAAPCGERRGDRPRGQQSRAPAPAPWPRRARVSGRAPGGASAPSLLNLNTRARPEPTRASARARAARGTPQGATLPHPALSGVDEPRPRAALRAQCRVGKGACLPLVPICWARLALHDVRCVAGSPPTRSSCFNYPVCWPRWLEATVRAKLAIVCTGLRPRRRGDLLAGAAHSSCHSLVEDTRGECADQGKRKRPSVRK